MVEFVFHTIFWTLALYGLFEIIKNIIYLCTYTNLKSNGIYIVIAVKNQEDKIEGFLRSLIFKILYGKEEYLNNVEFIIEISNEMLEKLKSNLDKNYLKMTKLDIINEKYIEKNINI